MPFVYLKLYRLVYFGSAIKHHKIKYTNRYNPEYINMILI